MIKTVLLATVLAVATVLAAGLTLLSSSIQEAQANPCSVYTGGAVEGDVDAVSNCDFEGIGSLVIIELGGLTETPFILPTP
jgi:hypothetical protein